MAMEKQYVVRDTHGRMLTAMGCNPTRREILVGYEDGAVKMFDSENGKLLQSFHEHVGWVTDFLFWAKTKLMLSCSNDGCIIIWGSAGLLDRIKIGMPVYCMAINPRRNQIVCGVMAGIRVYGLDEEKECGQLINNKFLHFSQEHTDIVRNIICNESRIFSAGYDHRLVIYDCSYTGDNTLEPVFINPQAHDAGISCLILARDHENSTWILTGSFDKTVKIWTVDGKLVHRLDSFISSISGVCFVPINTTVWVAGGLSHAILYDPKSGENVSDFIGTFQDEEEEKYDLQLLKFFPEINQVVASTSRRNLISWKYNSSGCITALSYRTPLDCVCYTKKFPILVFSGDAEGIIVKWERMQSNNFMYSKEPFMLSDSKLKDRKYMGSKVRDVDDDVKPETSKIGHEMSGKFKPITSQYSYNKSIIPPINTEKDDMTILKILFVESFDYILAASEDGNIYVWGFDAAAVEVLMDMKPDDIETLIEKYAVLLDPKSELLSVNTSRKSDSVTNRVAGFICKFVLSEHIGSITSMVVIGREHGFDETYLLSAGWDSRICIWNLDSGVLHDTYRSAISYCPSENFEIACDGVILDMDYSPENNEFAYSSSDRMVYIRRFDTNGLKMTLVSTLLGHEGDINAVQWNRFSKKWITGSEDGTIRIWASTGLTECEQILTVKGGVGCLCVDKTHGAIIAGVLKTIKVYEPENYHLVQSNVGHTDSVRCVIHIPERNQYVTCSWDKTIRVWNAWKLPRRRSQSINPDRIKTFNQTDMSQSQIDFNDDEDSETPETSNDAQSDTTNFAQPDSTNVAPDV